MEQLARTLSLPQSRVYYLNAKVMHIKIRVTLRASRVDRWIHAIKRDFLDAAPIKCVGLDCEFTDPREGRDNKLVAVLQLSVVTENLVFQICWADEVPNFSRISCRTRPSDFAVRLSTKMWKCRVRTELILRLRSTFKR
ncbi:uncharacterized protein [Lolium perenne]|uniref:uncharacterized protein n=1 Tax=Lolium perenne TaxID=4522 RepID=UPI003A9A5B42